MNRTIKVPFANPEHALIAKQVIEVDAELNPSAVKRTLSVDGENLIVVFNTSTIRLARLTANAFLENVDLVVRTLHQFGEDAKANKPTTTI
ncbi:transcription factor Pcc1 [Coprinellus micaceus]|uniref:Transcription factor Pcc1 n=1 Tax=Coprinellus micaceus TaxID=71717 RepID=A0A4Y7SYR1_COPMI|nr:transcription factor Pcc1 [Coprinellus micaceus]